MAEEEPVNNLQSQNPRQGQASVTKRLTSHSSYNASTSSLLSQSDFAHSPNLDATSTKENNLRPEAHHSHSHTHHDTFSRLVSQVQDWLHEEKEKRSQKLLSKSNQTFHPSAGVALRTSNRHESNDVARNQLQDSDLSDGVALEKLEQILAENIALHHDRQGTPIKDLVRSHLSRKASSSRHSRKGSAVVSSDTEYLDGDAVVPSAEVILDNSKTMSYSGGALDLGVDQSSSKKRAAKEREAWLLFKSEIVRLAHTLRLKGWRKVPLDRGGDIEVERLSGALTNAVYVVSPPSSLSNVSTDRENSSIAVPGKKPPP